jgi:hypothetical protein
MDDDAKPGGDMHCSRLPAMLALTIWSVAASADASAQVAAGACSGYDACALHVEGKRIVRGRSGELVLRMSPYTDVSRRVDWLSDSARVYASKYQPRRGMAANLRLFAWGTTIASAIIGYQVIRDYNRQADAVTAQQRAGVPVTATIKLNKSKLTAGSVLSAAGYVASWSAGRLETAARTQLARAVWWHNREVR